MKKCNETLQGIVGSVEESGHSCVGKSGQVSGEESPRVESSQVKEEVFHRELWAQRDQREKLEHSHLNLKMI